MEKIKISVIVPIYNVEQYLSQCLDSIINQTYTNLEIILINDGSTDNSEKICNQYKLLDPRIIVIHKTNGGLSDARNTGIKIATGDYISFVDADDFIDKNMYTILFQKINTTNADIIWYNHYNYQSSNEISKSSIFVQEKQYLLPKDNYKFQYDLLNKYHLIGYCWNKLYKKSIFNSILFPYNRKCEDGFILISLLNKSENIICIPNFLYYYRNTPNSLSKDTISYKFKLDFIESRLIRAIDFASLSPNTKSANTLLYRAYKYTLKFIINNPNKNYNIIYFYNHLKSLLFTNLSLRRKISIILNLIKYHHKINKF